MNALDPEQEYREYVGQTRGGENLGLDNFIEHQLDGGVWVEYGEKFYSALEWDENFDNGGDFPS